MLTPLLLFLNLSTGELIWILVLFVLLFGATKIPELARSLGKAQREFQRARDEIASEAQKPAETEEDRIRKAAADLGLATENKSTEQLRQEMADRLQRHGTT